MSDLFGTTTTPKRYGHPNSLIIGDMMLMVPRPEMKRRHDRGEYAGAHPCYLKEAGL